jgi:hypothetical protein
MSKMASPGRMGSGIPASDRATVSKPMAYFWTVVRDEIGIHSDREQAMSVPDTPDGLSKQRRGEKGINGQVNG